MAGEGYQFFRSVTDLGADLGADSTGKSDASEAINAAVSSWNAEPTGGDSARRGEECGNTFTQGAIVYFQSGTYKLCTPVIQLNYTQFIGDANDPPTIKGCEIFQRIALVDTDPYCAPCDDLGLHTVGSSVSSGIVTGSGETGCNSFNNALLAEVVVEQSDQSHIIYLYDNADCSIPYVYNCTYLDYTSASPSGGPGGVEDVYLGLGSNSNHYRPFLSHSVQSPHKVTDDENMAAATSGSDELG
ncbi:pectate lyase superfamily protein-domain-containing protein [Truncatella angustata]|uniref:Pectate lyase superfamily protein-domain-containing protein n=1 Tax=Truncatella angustata TaxID=152316 RepID=A0A9P8RFY2_9PEZI|nr:pectate lyase superfamily protein-domain-containing protein [Truncatella angustata]KAH6645288.1 pectate lyase superfamily protein-domain-containing protein [Truncatella angustata]